MMDYFLQQYKNEIKPLLKPIGFKIYNNTHFAKIISDEVVQSLTLVRVPGLYVCHARFDVIPLCYGENGYLRQGEELSRLWGKIENWTYDPRDENRVNEIVSTIVLGVKEYLIPYFEKTQTCKDAYEARIDLEKRSNMSRRVNDIKLNCCLKIGNYEKAADYINEYLEGYRESYKEKTTSPYYDEESRKFLIQRLQKRTEKFTNLLCHVENNDKEFIDQLLKVEEENLLASYKAKKRVTLVKGFFGS